MSNLGDSGDQQPPEDPRLTLEQDRLAFEREVQEERANLEEKRYKLEAERAEESKRFVTKHLGLFVTALLTIGAVTVSATQIYVAHSTSARDRELALVQRSAETRRAMSDRQRQWKLDLAEFVAKHLHLLRSESLTDRVVFRSLLMSTFPREITGAMFYVFASNAESDAERSMWESVAKAAAESAGLTDLLQYLIEVAEARARILYDAQSQEEVDEAVSMLTNPLFVDETGRELMMNYRRMIEFFREHTVVKTGN